MCQHFEFVFVDANVKCLNVTAPSFLNSSRLGCRDARRGNCRNRRLDVRNPHGRDQSPPADGRRSGDEEIQRSFSLHRGDGEGGGTWRVLQELGHQLPARVPRQHGGVHRVRARHRRPPGRTWQRWAASFRVWIVSTTSRHNDSCFFRVFLSVFVCLFQRYSAGKCQWSCDDDFKEWLLQV